MNRSALKYLPNPEAFTGRERRTKLTIETGMTSTISYPDVGPDPNLTTFRKPLYFRIGGSYVRYTFRLYDTNIAIVTVPIYNPDFIITLFTGTWKTNLTMRRMNAVFKAFFLKDHIYQSNWNWYLNENVFVDGTTIQRQQTPAIQAPTVGILAETYPNPIKQEYI